ncbi:tetraspanin-21-like [Saccoglossus kowalevskii]
MSSHNHHRMDDDSTSISSHNHHTSDDSTSISSHNHHTSDDSSAMSSHNHHTSDGSSSMTSHNYHRMDDDSSVKSSHRPHAMDAENAEFSIQKKSIENKKSQVHTVMLAVVVANILVGLVLVCIGSWIVIDEPVYYEMTAVTAHWPAILTIIAGVFLLIISCADTLTLYSNHPRDLRSFVMALIIIVSFELAAIITCGVKSSNLHGNGVLYQDMVESISDHYNQEESTREYWDTMQHAFQCCGINSYTDWQRYNNITIPVSCHCEMADPLLGCVQTVNSTLVFSNGCHRPLTYYLQYYFEVIELVNSLMIVIEIVVALGSVCRGCRVFRQSTVASYVVTM